MRTDKLLAFFLAALAVAFASCSKPESGQDGGGVNTSAARYRLLVDQSTLKANSVNIDVTTSADAGAWYCFVTTDTESALADVIKAEVASLDNIRSVLNAGNQRVTIKDLEPRTTYRAVVTGLDVDGTVFGTPDSEEFTTPLPEGATQLNNNWRCQYERRGDLALDDEGNTVYGDIIQFGVLEGTENTDFYLPAVVSRNEFEGTYGSDIAKFAAAELAGVQAEIDWRNEEGGQVMWNNYLLDAGMVGTLGVLNSDEQWYAVMIGANLDGKFTGLYSISELFTPTEEVANDSYSKWLGTWRITGFTASGGKTYEIITISPDENNYSYWVSNWERTDNKDIEFPPFHATFNRTTYALTFMAEDALQTVDMNDLDIENPENIDYGHAYIGFHGFYYEASWNQLLSVAGGEYPIAIATMADDGTVTVAEQDVDLSGGSVADLLGMWYAADLFEYVVNGQSGYMLNFEYVVPRFPYTMTREDTSAGPTAVREIDPAVKSAASARALRPTFARGQIVFTVPRFGY